MLLHNVYCTNFLTLMFLLYFICTNLFTLMFLHCFFCTNLVTLVFLHLIFRINIFALNILKYFFCTRIGNWLGQSTGYPWQLMICTQGASVCIAGCNRIRNRVYCFPNTTVSATASGDAEGRPLSNHCLILYILNQISQKQWWYFKGESTEIRGQNNLSR